MSHHTSEMEQEREAIMALVRQLEEAWNANDGAQFGAPFAEDADYTVWNGMYSKGREAIAQGHQGIFDTFYAGTRLETAVRSIRFLRNDVALVHLEGRILKPGGEPASDHPTCPLMVVSKGADGAWQIDAFQNTPKMPRPDAPS